MLEEHDRIVLTADISEERLETGDVGTIVHVHTGQAAYVVEFMTLDGDTAAIATLLPSQVRPVTNEDITHARKMAMTT